MKSALSVITAATLAIGVAAAQQPTQATQATQATAVRFAEPVMLRTQSGAAIRVEAPGYAAPCWADIDGDGRNDLLVGQFRDGKIKVYRGIANAADDSAKVAGRDLADGKWLEAEDEVAEVPGVW